MNSFPMNTDMVGFRPTAFETVAARMLARDGVEVIWQLYLRAAASYGRGNWRSAVALVSIARHCRAGLARRGLTRDPLTYGWCGE